MFNILFPIKAQFLPSSSFSFGQGLVTKLIHYQFESGREKIILDWISKNWFKIGYKATRMILKITGTIFYRPSGRANSIL